LSGFLEEPVLLRLRPVIAHGANLHRGSIRRAISRLVIAERVPLADRAVHARTAAGGLPGKVIVIPAGTP
jgi:hypothetical protein